VRRDGGPQVPVAEGQGDGRHQRHQLHGVHARRAGRLRPLGQAGQRRMELRGRVAVLQEIGGRQAEPADGVAVPRTRRLPQGRGAKVED